jgi:1-deoxy-D-xylulose-5-phosphate reductoisomerase
VIGIAILGATGSIGASTLEVVRAHPQRFRVVALAAREADERLFAQLQEFEPSLVALADGAAAGRLEARVRAAGLKTTVLAGPEGLAAVATHPEAAAVMAAVVGSAGLPPTLAALRAGKRVLLANKESLVMAGADFMAALSAGGGALVPIDSELNALFQCMPAGWRAGEQPRGVKRVILTASGGPFRDWSAERIARATPEQACAHPRWRMGPKISVDSATLMNKGLELIEAHWLFGLPARRIDVVVHPQSIVHSLVEYDDGSTLAQLGNPDMRTPIAHALAHPERIAAGVAPLDLVAQGRLDFEPPDRARFPCLGLGYAALEAGGAAPLVLNAANEVAVARFLAGGLAFGAIAGVVEGELARFAGRKAEGLDAVLALDAEVRAQAAAAAAARGAA